MFDNFVKSAKEFLDLLTNTSVGTTLTAIGLILLFVALYTLQKLFKTKPEDTSEWLKFIAAGSLVAGVVFSGAGPSFALMKLNENRIRTLSKDEAFDNLNKNKRINWAIRLIPYSPGAESDLDLPISKLKTLGPPTTAYTFVSPYAELKGYSVEDAVNMSGSKLTPGQRVSAIIFPVEESVIPASGRGLLQVIQKIDYDNSNPVKERFISQIGLSADEIDDLANQTNLDSWSWQGYGRRFNRYCKIAHKFRCGGNFEEKRSISKLERDWHPAGATKATKQEPCLGSDSYCDVDDWDQLKEQIRDSFGARIFFIKNISLDKLRTRYMIDFDNPKHQIIPDIGVNESDH
ncbi:hypothetical protein [Methylobacterium soli]|uniref:Uncharacterized protein n=1 Tax=Methylobacterium soli TaxID=553447 RepID=A0A6L3SW55_9HYPH|nr:hypothetical protein [Methylobacterium soli]KAB1078060.1 hypothetical protein F6X53_16320 [Methylobacterium soli]